MGKVHGSLARAGKVRGQTPKVAKQDKKKLPKGRAIKRLKVREIPLCMICRLGLSLCPGSRL
ncbi:40S ribosomal protein S30 [bacterium]|nr:40S ribosomal protein S30 [bacterium]